MQVLLEECKYPIKKKKIVNTINEDLELRESDESDEFLKKFLWINSKYN